MFKHQPKGSMCMICCHAHDDCSGLEFSAMKAIKTLLKDEVVIVKCSVFVKKEA